MKLYTKGGDKGRTSLIGGERASKCDLRVEAYGTVDELQANIAYLADKMMHEKALLPYVEDCRTICSLLMTACSLLAVGNKCDYKMPQITEENITWIEGRIDDLQEALKPVEYFTIPGGCELSSSHPRSSVSVRQQSECQRASGSCKNGRTDPDLRSLTDVPY